MSSKPVFASQDEDFTSSVLSMPRPIPLLSPDADKFIFQLLDIEHVIPQKTSVKTNRQYADSNKEAYFRLFGLTEQGNSVNVNVRGFIPYFFIKFPASILKIASSSSSYSDSASTDAMDDETENEFTRKIMHHFNSRAVISKLFPNQEWLFESNPPVSKVELCERGYSSLYYYQSQKDIDAYRFIKVSVRSFQIISKFKEGLNTQRIGLPLFLLKNEIEHLSDPVLCEVFEGTVNPITRFMTDIDMFGPSWIQVDMFGTPVSTEHFPQFGPVDDIFWYNTSCQIHIIADIHQIECFKAEGEWQKIAPLRIMSFDIECAGRKGLFPDALWDPVIQISCVIKVMGGKTSDVEAQKTVTESDLPKLYDQKIVLVLNTCDPLTDTSDAGEVHIRQFKDEKELLKYFSRYVQYIDPDIITGYNIKNFDIPYLINRAKYIHVQGFNNISRVHNFEIILEKKVFESAQAGRRENIECDIPGRIVIDMLPYMQSNFKLPAYSLNVVARSLLNDQKNDLDHSLITLFHNTSSKRRAKIASYCLKDSKLPLQLIEKYKVIFSLIEMSRVTGVPIKLLLTRGQQIKVMTMMYSYGRKHKIYIPDSAPHYNSQKKRKDDDVQIAEDDNEDDADDDDDNEDEDDDGHQNHAKKKRKSIQKSTTTTTTMKLTKIGCGSDDNDNDDDADADVVQETEGYQGATVLDPIRGFYNVPIATLDFASLYPSIMMAHNLCYTTLVHPFNVKSLIQDLEKIHNDEELQKLKQSRAEGNQSYQMVPYNPDLYLVKSPTGNVFVKKIKKEGILPMILQHLTAMRKATRAAQKTVQCKITWAVLEERQKAYKLVSNSIYGFTGASVGKLPCLEIASTVTSIGRTMIEATKSQVEAHYTVKNGYKHDAIVIYGDTDSVMVKFGDSITLVESLALGHQAAEIISKTFISPIKLEFEKCYFPYLLQDKKRYAGVFWTNSTKYDKLDVKGIETVRRDTCQLVQKTMKKCLDYILLENSPQKALDHAIQAISNLLTNNVNYDELILSKNLSKANYTTKMPHDLLAKKMRARDPNSAPVVGARVNYLILADQSSGSKKLLSSERAEDPLYACNNELLIDGTYYLEQLKKPILRLFKHVIPDAENKLFKGDHMRVITKVLPATPTQKDGTVKKKSNSMMSFIKVSVKCEGCGYPSSTIGTKKGSIPLCDKCMPNVEEHKKRITEQKNSLKKQLQDSLNTCMKCVETDDIEDILITNCCVVSCANLYVRNGLVKKCNKIEQAHKSIHISCE